MPIPTPHTLKRTRTTIHCTVCGLTRGAHLEGELSRVACIPTTAPVVVYAYYNFNCCADNEFKATYSLGKLVEFNCTTCKSVYQLA